MEFLLSDRLHVLLNHRVVLGLLQDVVSHCFHGVVLLLHVLVKWKLGQCLLVQLMGLGEVRPLDFEVSVLQLANQELDVLDELLVLQVGCLLRVICLLLLDCRKSHVLVSQF